MRIDKVSKTNYRVLKNIDLDLEKDLSLIIGKNNCGKISVLSILNKFIGNQSALIVSTMMILILIFKQNYLYRLRHQVRTGNIERKRE